MSGVYIRVSVDTRDRIKTIAIATNKTIDSVVSDALDALEASMEGVFNV